MNINTRSLSFGYSIFVMFESAIVVIPKKEEIRDKYVAIVYKKKKNGKSTKKEKQRSTSSH